ncbi:protein NLRC3 isoform X2 [Dendrobium catenatum]|uniref:protein NLRC3 isoform X2 n=1 Tax=Dendrobium catenatum TaxID=906689 RepID=UPI0009F5ED92|nr:protein NLRC3 isoform X2 [Dendrobium catenatum]
MKEIPSLFSLCVKIITWNIMHGCGQPQDLFELPSVFLDGLLMMLPPLALQNIYELTIGSTTVEASIVNSINIRKKRGRYNESRAAWKTLYKKRWPENIKWKDQSSYTAGDHCVEAHESTASVIDWQQLYWERHLQDCLDAATEQALLPAFGGNIAELKIPDSIMSLIGHIGSGDCNCSNLSYHCNKFGCYARCMRLQSVLCHDKILDFLRTSKLEALVFRRILSGRHVDGVCKLITQNRETLISLELVYCKLSPLDMEMICNSVYDKEIHSHGIRHFSITSSTIFGSKSSSIPCGLSFFLSSGRSLHSVRFTDTRLGLKAAEFIFEILIKSSSSLVNLELSGNELEGLLSKVGRKYISFSPVLESPISLQSLVELNLRGNNLQMNDMVGLYHVLVNMPKLSRLDLSDNPIRDDGVRRLIPFFVKDLEVTSQVTEMWLENCDLSGTGASELLQSLTMKTGQLKTLSFADNDLGSSVAAPLAKFLGASRIRNLNIEGIGLGPFGFQELERKMPNKTTLAHLNISKNRGGIQAAHFIHRIVSQALDLVSINAGSNLLPPESLSIIQDALRKSNGKLEELDLTGNASLHSPNSKSVISQFQFQGNLIIKLPSFCPSSSAYDDDP